MHGASIYGCWMEAATSLVRYITEEAKEPVIGLGVLLKSFILATTHLGY